MSQHISNFNYPSANLEVNFDGGGGGTVVANQDPARLHERFLLTDNMQTFQAIPKKQVGQNAYIPVTNSINVANWHRFKRRLYLNQRGTFGTGELNKKFIPITRPSANHKAYLHAITYTAYDFNEMLPRVTAQDKASLIVADVFGDGIDGLKVNNTVMLDNEIRNASIPKSSYFSSADYPVYRDQTLAERSEEVALMERLGQSAPRSSIRFGMLPGDWLMNNFNCQILGIGGTPNFETVNSGFTKVWELPSINSSYPASINADVSNDTDMIIPGITNEIDIEIPEGLNWLAVEVWGAGWRHGAFDDEVNEMYRLSAKGVFPASQSYYTYVQMPVKVQIDIRYWEEPQIIEGT